MHRSRLGFVLQSNLISTWVFRASWFGAELSGQGCLRSVCVGSFLFRGNKLVEVNVTLLRGNLHFPHDMAHMEVIWNYVHMSHMIAQMIWVVYYLETELSGHRQTVDNLVRLTLVWSRVYCRFVFGENKNLTLMSVTSSGIPPGDGRGAGGIDSWLFTHLERNWLRKVTKTTEKIRQEIKARDKQTDRKRPAEIIKVKRIESVTDRSDWLRDSDGMIYRKIKKSSFKMTNQARKRDRKGGNVGRSRLVFD